MNAHDIAAIKGAADLPRLIAETIHLRREGRLWKACCPFHSEKTPSFVVYEDGYHCYGCGAHGDVLDWLQRQRGMTFSGALLCLGGSPQPPRRMVSPPPPPPPPANDDEDAARKIALAKVLWGEATRAAGSPAETYLQSRGLRLPSYPVLKFHPACPRGSERLPAMLALITDPIANTPCGVHRTFLRPDGRGKIDTGTARMMLGHAGVIRLVPDEEVTLGLGICEGIETGLAVMQHFGFSPVWAACSAGGIAKLPVLNGIEAIRIFADMDDSGAGIGAARACARTWAAAGRGAVIKKPPLGTDWHDVAANHQQSAA